MLWVALSWPGLAAESPRECPSTPVITASLDDQAANTACATAFDDTLEERDKEQKRTHDSAPCSLALDRENASLLAPRLLVRALPRPAPLRAISAGTVACRPIRGPPAARWH